MDRVLIFFAFVFHTSWGGFLHHTNPQVVYVPVCSAECFKNGHENYQNLGQETYELQHQSNHHSVHHGSGVSHQVLQQVHSPDLGETHSAHDDHHHKKNIHYNFEYSVEDHKTGDIKKHKEERKGDEVHGEYSLLEEDGNIRTVKYFADWKTGFHAQVHNTKPKFSG